APDRGQILLAHAEQVDARAAGHLDRRNLVTIDDVGDPTQFRSIRLAAPHPRYHREAAVLLDVGVGALVDVARLRVVLRLLRPGADQVVVDRRPATRATAGLAPFHEIE